MTEQRYSNIIGHDDRLAPDVPDVPLWNETFAGMFGDSHTGISGIFYLGRWWGYPTTMRKMVGFMLPGDRAALARSYGPTRDGLLPSAAGLTMDPGPDGAIHYTYKGPADLRKQSDVSANGLRTGPTVLMEADFTFTPVLPVWDMHAGADHHEDNNLMFPGGHMEQLGSMRGTVKVGDETFRIEDAHSVRDHSRGVRDFRKHQAHIWINGRFGSNWGFCCFRARIVGQPGYAMNSGVVFKDGKIYPATIESNADIEPGSDIWKPIDLTLNAQGLAPIKVRIKKMWNIYQLGMFEPADIYWGTPNGEPDAAAMWSLEQSAQFESNGEKGFGHIERCNRDVVVDDGWRKMCTPEKLIRR